MMFVPSFLKSLARFRSQDSGAVTVDFIVVTAVIVGVSIAVLGSVSVGATDLADNVSDTVSKLDMWGLAGGPGE